MFPALASVKQQQQQQQQRKLFIPEDLVIPNSSKKKKKKKISEITLHPFWVKVLSLLKQKSTER